MPLGYHTSASWWLRNQLGNGYGLAQSGPPFRASVDFMIGSLAANPSLFVKDTQTPRGRGVFTHRPYRAGEVVEVCPVVTIPSPWEALPESVKRVVYDWGQLLGNEPNQVHAFALGVGSLFNRSPRPNLAFCADMDRQALVFTAQRDIVILEELTLDYNDDIPEGHPDWFESLGITPIL